MNSLKVIIIYFPLLSLLQLWTFLSTITIENVTLSFDQAFLLSPNYSIFNTVSEENDSSCATWLFVNLVLKC